MGINRPERIFLLKKRYSERGLFWSYPRTKIEDISDDLLIDAMLRFAKDDELDELGKLFTQLKIRTVWKKTFAGEPRFEKRNLKLSAYIFKEDDPEKYAAQSFKFTNPFERFKRLMKNKE